MVKLKAVGRSVNVNLGVPVFEKGVDTVLQLSVGTTAEVREDILSHRKIVRLMESGRLVKLEEAESLKEEKPEKKKPRIVFEETFPESAKPPDQLPFPRSKPN